jgi:hypothetical protein
LSTLAVPLRAAVLELRRRRKVAAIPSPVPQLPFGEWMARAQAEYDWTAPHFLMMQDALDRVTRGEIRRVFFQVPIRHGKTQHNTIGYAVARLEADPSFRWLVGSYNQRQAEKISREIRKLAKARGILISADRDTAGEWETEAGGGVRAVGAGAGVASVNADGILIDDPIGSRDDAESQAKRDQVWDWLTNDILARCEPHTAVLMSMSRWHQDDPAGRLRDRFGALWTVIDLPGRAEPHDPLAHRARRVRLRLLDPRSSAPTRRRDVQVGVVAGARRHPTRGGDGPLLGLGRHRSEGWWPRSRLLSRRAPLSDAGPSHGHRGRRAVPEVDQCARR